MRTNLTTCLLAILSALFAVVEARAVDPPCDDPFAPSCFGPHPSPGCAPQECCKAVCAFDPFCCFTNWDQNCTLAAMIICTPCPICPPGSAAEVEPCGSNLNSGCEGVTGAPSIVLFEQQLACDGGVCGTLWADAGQSDSDWYWVVLPDPDGDGSTAVSISFGANAPARVEAFSGLCGALSPHWSFSTAACAGLSTPNVCLPAGVCYFRVSMDVSSGFPCTLLVPAEYTLSLDFCFDYCDCDSDGIPDGDEPDWDGDGTPDDCDPCFRLCPAGATPEGDACGGETNGGCNFSPELFGSISCGETICGTAWADNNVRDLDWYEFFTPSPCDVLFSVHAEFESAVFIIDGSAGCGQTVVLVSAPVAACTTDTFSATLPAGGPYWFVVAPSVFNGYPCWGGENDYSISLTCGCSDCDQDGVPDSQESDPYCCQCICMRDPFCCQSAWDAICEAEAQLVCNKDCNGNGTLDTLDVILGVSRDCNMNCIPDECESQTACLAGDTPEGEPCGSDVNGGCNLPIVGSSSCCSYSGGIGCDDAACESAVCLAISSCCTVEWDYYCASEAVTLCPSICQLGPAQFGSIGCGETICGTAWANNGLRDTDWFQFCLSDWTDVTFTASAEFPFVVGIINTGGVPDCLLATALDQFAIGDAQNPQTFTVSMPAGTWWLFIAPTTFNGLPCGCLGTYRLTVDVNPHPSPPTNVFATDAVICVGESTTLEGTVGANETIVWRLDSCTGPVVGTGSPFTVSPTTDTTYYAGASLGCFGCPSTCVVVTVMVNPAPDEPTTVPATICEDESLALIASFAVGTTIEWYDVPCGTLGATALPIIPPATTPVVSPTGTTTYYVVATDANGCMSDCVPLVVTVVEPPMVTVVGDTDVCVNDSVSLMAQVSPLTPTATYKWFEGTCANPGAQKATTPGYSPSSSAAGTFLYHVEVTVPGSGCTVCEDVTLTVSDPPMVTVVGDADVCVNDSVSLMAQVSPLTPTATYKWFEGTCANPGAQKATTPGYSPSSSAAGTFLYHVEVTVPGSGCTVCQDVTLTVSDPPMVTIAGSSDVCKDASASLMASASTTSSFQWYDGACPGQGSSLGNAASQPIDTATAGTFVYSVVATDSLTGCTTCEQFAVTVNSPPAVTISPSQPTVCQGTCCAPQSVITLTANTSVPPASIVWSTGGCSQTVVHTGATYDAPRCVPGTTTYYVTVTDPLTMCSSCEAVTVTVNPPGGCASIPVATGCNNFGCPSMSYKYFAIKGTPSGAKYSWRIMVDGCIVLENLSQQGPSSGDAQDIAQNLLDNIRQRAIASGCQVCPTGSNCQLFPATLAASSGSLAYFNIGLGLQSTAWTLWVGPELDPCCQVIPCTAVCGAQLPFNCDEATCSSWAPCVLNSTIQEITLVDLDCNANGQDDMIDLLAGISFDEDGDGILDECQTCVGDLNVDGVVGGADLGLLLGAWGTDGGATGIDLNGDGVVDGADLGLVLGAWGECEVPCLGDLDDSGAVDGSDLGLLLGAWGTDGAEIGADLNDDGLVDGGDLGLVLGAWGACPTASAALIAYEGFDYRTPGSELSSYPAGGVGWLDAWGDLADGAWSVTAPGLAYSDSDGNALVVGGGRIQGRAAMATRTLALDQGPLGDAPGTLWISMLAEQGTTAAEGSWLGLGLPVTSASRYLLLGKPPGAAHWGMEAGAVGTRRLSGIPSAQPALLVLRIDFMEGPDSVALWVNPTLAGEPPLETASIHAPAYGEFTGITSVRVNAGGNAGELSGGIDEIRIGRTYGDVAPIDRSASLPAPDGAVPRRPIGEPSSASSALRR